jgi:hypothetical protein
MMTIRDRVWRWLTGADEQERRQRDHEMTMALLDAAKRQAPPAPSYSWRSVGDPWPTPSLKMDA